MDPKYGHEFRSSMPTMAAEPLAPGQQVFDEGVYVCVACGLPGSEARLLPGDETPECASCGADARWMKT